MARRIARAPRRRPSGRSKKPATDRSEFVNPNDPEWRKNVVTMYQDARVFIDGKYRMTATITPTAGINAAAETVASVARVGARIEVRQDDNSWFFTNTENGVVPESIGGMREAPRRGVPADETAANELVLYIENTSDLSPDGPRGQGRDVLLNALRKYRKGTYDPTLAIKLFAYLVESGAKRYAKEFGSSEREWSTMFPPATRQEAARQLEASFRSSAEQGEYDRVDVRTGGAARGVSAREPDRRMRGQRRGAAPHVGARVEAGVDDGYDTGVVFAIRGDEADVGWDSGIRTWIEIRRLHVISSGPDAGRVRESSRSMEASRMDDLFIGTYPTGIAYADKAREEHGDYARCAFLDFDSLDLRIERSCPDNLRRAIKRHASNIQARRGEQYETDASGHTITLGGRKRGRVYESSRDRDRPISMTYGTLPPFEQFEQDIRRPDPERPGQAYWPKGTLYPMELVVEHEIDLADEFGGLEKFRGQYGKRGFRGDERQIYDFLTFLAGQDDLFGDDDGEGGSGDLASSIMTTLGYEWI